MVKLHVQVYLKFKIKNHMCIGNPWLKIHCVLQHVCKFIKIKTSDQKQF